MHRGRSAVRFVLIFFLLGIGFSHMAYPQESSGADDRAYSLQVLQRIADPVLTSLSENRLKQSMPVEGGTDRAAYTHLEALGRLLAGMAPWLELGPDDTPEGKLRARYIHLAVVGIAHATDQEWASNRAWSRHGESELTRNCCSAGWD